MALFKSLFKKEKPVSTVPPEDFPELFNGMKAEVLTPANALIFVGRIRLLAETRWTSWVRPAASFPGRCTTSG